MINSSKGIHKSIPNIAEQNVCQILSPKQESFLFSRADVFLFCEAD